MPDVHCALGSKHCPPCKYTDLASTWRAKLLIKGPQPYESWLLSTAELGVPAKHEWGVGCAVCCRYGEDPDNPYAQFKISSIKTLQFSNLQRHSTTPGHVMATQAFSTLDLDGHQAIASNNCEVTNATVSDNRCVVQSSSLVLYVQS